MSDRRLRELERRWLETEAEADEVVLLLEQLKVGELHVETLRLAAALGHRSARVALGEGAPEQLASIETWDDALGEHPTATARACVALAWATCADEEFASELCALSADLADAIDHQAPLRASKQIRKENVGSDAKAWARQLCDLDPVAAAQACVLLVRSILADQEAARALRERTPALPAPLTDLAAGARFFRQLKPAMATRICVALARAACADPPTKRALDQIVAEQTTETSTPTDGPTATATASQVRAAAAPKDQVPSPAPTSSPAPRPPGPSPAPCPRPVPVPDPKGHVLPAAEAYLLCPCDDHLAALQVAREPNQSKTNTRLWPPPSPATAAIHATADAIAGLADGRVARLVSVARIAALRLDPTGMREAILTELVPALLGRGDPIRERVEARQRSST